MNTNIEKKTIEDNVIWIILTIVGIFCFYVTIQSFFGDNN